MYIAAMNKPSCKFPKGPMDMVVLAMLERNQMHGYQIVQELCKPRVKIVGVLCMGEGTLYPLLRRLEKKKFVKSTWQKMSGRRNRRVYDITGKGKAELQHLRKCWRILVLAVKKVCDFV